MIAAFFDFDGTLFRGHFWEGVVKYHFLSRQKRTQLALFLASHMTSYFRSKLKTGDSESFKIRWGEDLAAIFKGITPGEGTLIFQWIAAHYVPGLLRPDILSLLRRHRAKGHLTMLLSASYTDFLRELQPELGVDYVIGTTLEVKDGAYSGRILSPLCFGEDKARLLREFTNKNGLDIDLAGSYAYADSASDVPVLEMVGNPVAVYPDKKLLALANQRGWRVLDGKLRN